MAKYFNVATDYLIGASDYPLNQDAQTGRATRLSDKSIKLLNDNPFLVMFFNYLVDEEFTEDLIEDLIEKIGADMCLCENFYLSDMIPVYRNSHNIQIPETMFDYYKQISSANRFDMSDILRFQLDNKLFFDRKLRMNLYHIERDMRYSEKLKAYWLSYLQPETQETFD